MPHFDSNIERQQFIKEHALRLESILREMEDLQMKILALQVEAQYEQSLVIEAVHTQRLSRDSKKELP
jgi:hypothetical protein